LWENEKRKYFLEDVDEGGKLVLKYIVNKCDMAVGTA
jgi:hypothetical protein